MNLSKTTGPLALSAILLLLGACRSPDTSIRALDSGVVPIYEAAVGLEIGSSDGDGADVFGRVGGLIEDADGRIHIGDVQANEVRVFSADGTHLFTFGEPGAGPGELDGPCCFGFDPYGQLWIRDNGNRRYNGYIIEDSGARFVEQRQMEHRSGGYWTQLTFGHDGALVDVGHTMQPGGEFGLVRYYVAEDGSLGASELAPVVAEEDRGITAIPLAGGGGRVYVRQPFGPRQVVGHGPAGRWAHVLTSSYNVTSHSPAGTVQITREVDGPPLSDDQRERGEEALQRDMTRAGIGANDLPFSIPERHTPVRWLYYDAHGHLWIERTVPDTGPREADIFTDGGTRIAEVHWPREVDLRIPGWIGSTSALGVRRDSLGVETVVRLTFDNHGMHGTGI